ncbi:hypothetical protein Godav_013809 [Gossypium davidsonii]|uniref:Uncharacterized protein n=1 Tax=Gossypium davidsonii TaxID=34287 RepID=A0A7J8RHS4_GOSDV|nr:hypothetical protein [Gossypium davidsonii]
MSDSEILPGDRVRAENDTNEDRNTKKVRFKDVGKDSTEKHDGRYTSNGANDMDLEIEDGDTLRSTINGIPAIDFSKRLKKSWLKTWKLPLLSSCWDAT